MHGLFALTVVALAGVASGQFLSVSGPSPFDELEQDLQRMVAQASVEPHQDLGHLREGLLDRMQLYGSPAGQIGTGGGWGVSRDGDKGVMISGIMPKMSGFSAHVLRNVESSAPPLLVVRGTPLGGKPFQRALRLPMAMRAAQLHGEYSPKTGRVRFQVPGFFNRDDAVDRDEERCICGLMHAMEAAFGDRTAEEPMAWMTPRMVGVGQLRAHRPRFAARGFGLRGKPMRLMEQAMHFMDDDMAHFMGGAHMSPGVVRIKSGPGFMSMSFSSSSSGSSTGLGGLFGGLFGGPMQRHEHHMSRSPVMPNLLRILESARPQLAEPIAATWRLADAEDVAPAKPAAAAAVAKKGARKPKFVDVEVKSKTDKAEWKPRLSKSKETGATVVNFEPLGSWGDDAAAKAKKAAVKLPVAVEDKPEVVFSKEKGVKVVRYPIKHEAEQLEKVKVQIKDEL